MFSPFKPDIFEVVALTYFSIKFKSFFWRFIQRYFKVTYKQELLRQKKLGLFFFPFEKLHKNESLIFGPLGSSTMQINDSFSQFVKIQDKNTTIFYTYLTEKNFSKNLENQIVGVTNGYIVELNLSGVGYKIETKNNNLLLRLGKSNFVVFPKIIEGVKCFEINPQSIKIFGLNKQVVNNFAAKIRILGGESISKGIRYNTEIVFKKLAKKK